MRKYKEISKANWLACFENYVVRARPDFAGKIDWDSAVHIYNLGLTARDAAGKYLYEIETSTERAED